MPPKLKLDEYIEAFSDERVAKAISAALIPYMRDCLISIVRQELDKFSTQQQAITDELKSQRKCMSDLLNDNAQLRKHIDSLETDSRLNSLVIRGLPEASAAERASGAGLSNSVKQSATLEVQPPHADVTERAILQMCNDDLHLNLQSSDIELAYRMKGSSAESSRPILVRFLSRKVRNTVFDLRRRLKSRKDCKVFISENLTKAASELFFEARKMQREKRLYGCWTASGNIFVKRTETGKPIMVRNLEALNLATRA